MMTNLGEAALQSPVVMTIRHVSSAGMNCPFRCLIIILGLIFEEVDGGVGGLRKKLADFIERNPDHEISGGSTGETFAIEIRRQRPGSARNEPSKERLGLQPTARIKIL